MYQALIAACCALAGVQPPLTQDWSDTGLIRADDDWSDVPAVVGYRGDGLVAAPGTDPRRVVADGSGTPVDVAANRTDPGAIGLAAGVAEFELPNPVVALRGSATASAPQLVIALDTRGRAGIAVRLTLRDIDTTADAVQAVAVQYRVGGTGSFAGVPGGYVPDATEDGSFGIDSVNGSSGELETPVGVALPAAADDEQHVEVRVITTDAIGRDEWIGVDDIEVTAATIAAPRCGTPRSRPWPGGTPVPAPQPGPPAGPPSPPAPAPRRAPPALTALTLSPDVFAAARRGPALALRGRAGAALRFRLSEPASVRFRIGPRGNQVGAYAGRGTSERLRFQVRGRRGLNRMRFTGRIRGRRLASAGYVLTGVAMGRRGLESAPASVRFRIEGQED
jgi:hypothetical protein